MKSTFKIAMACKAILVAGAMTLQADGELSRLGNYPSDIRVKDDSKSAKRVGRYIERVKEIFDRKVHTLATRGVAFPGGKNLPTVPTSPSELWPYDVRGAIWGGVGTRKISIDGVYREALANSNQIKIFADSPLIRRTAIQEAKGIFDPDFFLDYRHTHIDEPVGSTLTTGATGPSRFKEYRHEVETGIKKRFITGTELSLSTRIGKVKNNSEFFTPRDQGQSEVVLSVVQPLLRGAGIQYNTAPIKIAKLDTLVSQQEFIRQLQAHLHEVNRAYWALYLARAAYLQKRHNESQAGAIVSDLEAREDLDAVQSELLRARSTQIERRATVIRAEMAIQNAEERLRALIEDPTKPSTYAEVIPVSPPVLTFVGGSIREVASSAIDFRPEMLQGYSQLHAAAIRRDVAVNEILPELNVVGEATLTGLDDDGDAFGAYGRGYGEGAPGYVAGVTFNMPIGNNAAKARLSRRVFEYQQQRRQLLTTADTVLFEATIAQRELETAYRDMQGKWQTVLATRNEMKQIRERMKAGVNLGKEETSRSLQLLLDALDRNGFAEDSFLASVVAYNVAILTVERAKGTLLLDRHVTISRIMAEGELDRIVTE